MDPSHISLVLLNIQVSIDELGDPESVVSKALCGSHLPRLPEGSV